MQGIAKGLQGCVWGSQVRNIPGQRGSKVLSRKATAGGQAAAPLGVHISRPRPNTPVTPDVKAELLDACLTPARA